MTKQILIKINYYIFIKLITFYNFFFIIINKFLDLPLILSNQSNFYKEVVINI